MKAKLSTEDFDRTFDAGDDITPHLDLDRATRPNLTARRVNVDFPAWMVDGLDARAAHLGITRQALIKLWIGERLETLQVKEPIEKNTNTPSNVTPIARHIGRRIRHRRWVVGMTQEQLGTLVEMSTSSIQHYETGRSNIDAPLLSRISEVLDVPIVFFFEGLEETGEDSPVERGDLLADKEALELVRSYYSIPEAERHKLFDVVAKLKIVA